MTKTMKKHIVWVMALLSAVACKDNAIEQPQVPDFSNVDPLIRDLRTAKSFRTVVVGTPEWDSLRAALAAKAVPDGNSHPVTKSGPTVFAHRYHDTSTDTGDWIDGDGQLVRVVTIPGGFNNNSQFRVDNPMEAVVVPDMLNRPDSVHAITGVLAKATGETFQHWWAITRKINADGTLRSERLFTSANAPAQSNAQASVQLPSNWPSSLVYIAVGVGARVQNSITNLGLYMVPYNPATKTLVINSINDVVVLLPQEWNGSASFERQIRIWDCTGNLEEMKRMIVSGIGGRNNNNSVTRIGIKTSTLAM
jgi:hypothetical protein